MATYKTEGIILKRTDFGEADRILTVFTKHYGKIHILAKGVKRTESRKAGQVELLNHCALFIAQGRNLDILSEAETLANFQPLKENLELSAQAYYLIELVDKITAEREENRQVFLLLQEALTLLSRKKEGKNQALILAFQVKLLDLAGFWSTSELKVAPQTLEVLKILESETLEKTADTELDDALVVEIGNFLRYYIERVIETKLKSPQLIKEVSKLSQ